MIEIMEVEASVNSEIAMELQKLVKKLRKIVGDAKNCNISSNKFFSHFNDAHMCLDSMSEILDNE